MLIYKSKSIDALDDKELKRAFPSVKEIILEYLFYESEYYIKLGDKHFSTTFNYVPYK